MTMKFTCMNEWMSDSFIKQITAILKIFIGLFMDLNVLMNFNEYDCVYIWAWLIFSSCADCHPSCASCNGSSESQCIQCKPNRFSLEGKCLTLCPDGFYSDKKRKECLPVSTIAWFFLKRNIWHI